MLSGQLRKDKSADGQDNDQTQNDGRHRRDGSIATAPAKPLFPEGSPPGSDRAIQQKQTQVIGHDPDIVVSHARLGSGGFANDRFQISGNARNQRSQVNGVTCANCTQKLQPVLIIEHRSQSHHFI